jgi:hypothetical protein
MPSKTGGMVVRTEEGDSRCKKIPLQMIPMVLNPHKTRKKVGQNQCPQPQIKEITQ